MAQNYGIFAQQLKNLYFCGHKKTNFTLTDTLVISNAIVTKDNLKINSLCYY